MGILLPVLGKIRRQGRALAGMNNQRQIVCAVNLFASDNDDRYPESVATLGREPDWNWGEPMKLTGYRARYPRAQRSVSAYLRTYLANAETISCPSAPREYKYLKEAWAAGDDWDNPETPPKIDPVSVNYCLYWNYTGYIEGRSRPFEGPRGPLGGRGRSKLVVSCYFGYDHHRNRGAYGSCQQFRRASITEGSLLSSDYWSAKPGAGHKRPVVKLYAGYTDGHVESYSSSDTTLMLVILHPDTGEPYPFGLGPGVFYLPSNALQ